MNFMMATGSRRHCRVCGGPTASRPIVATALAGPVGFGRSHKPWKDRESDGLKSAACGSPPRRAYRLDRRRGRVAEGGGLLNRYRVVKPYRGFESLRLRHLLRADAPRRMGTLSTRP